MAIQTSMEPKSTVFKKRQGKNEGEWFVRVSCNFLKPRIYGPFPDEQDAERFRDGAEFELRKLLDYQLPTLSHNFRFTPPPMG